MRWKTKNGILKKKNFLKPQRKDVPCDEKQCPGDWWGIDKANWKRGTWGVV